METELIPVRLITSSGANFYFHDKESDNLYILKDSFVHKKLSMFGTFRNLYLEENDLIFANTLSNVKDVIIVHFERYD
jgi:hypothetical protein